MPAPLLRSAGFLLAKKSINNKGQVQDNQSRVSTGPDKGEKRPDLKGGAGPGQHGPAGGRRHTWDCTLRMLDRGGEHEIC